MNGIKFKFIFLLVCGLLLVSTASAIDFVTPSDSTGTVSRSFVLANVTVVDANFANVTIYLYNSSGSLENSTFSTSNITYVNISGLDDGLYRLNATAYDVTGNSNSTGTENITISILYLNMSFVTPTPEDGNIFNVSVNHTINVSISTVGNLSSFNFSFNGTNTILYNDSLVLMYNFEDGNYPTNDVTDLSSVSSNGSVINAVNITGKYGQGIYLDGDEDYIDGQDSVDLVDTPFTINFWINKTAHASGVKALICKYNNLAVPYAGEYYSYVNSSGSILFGVIDTNLHTGYITTESNNALTDGEWNFVSFVYRGGNSSDIYINGVNETLKVTNYNSFVSIKDTNNNFTIGAINSQGTINTEIDAAFDNVAIYTRAMSNDEINQLYKSNLDKYNSSLWIFTSYQNELDNGNYTYQAFASDSLGYSNETESQWFYIEATPTVVMSAPDNLSLVNVSAQTFVCNTTGAYVDFMNITIWNSTDDIIAYNKTTLGNTTASVSWANTFTYDDTYKWACYVDVGGTTYWGDGNWTIELDTAAPTLDYAANSTGAGLGSTNYIFISMAIVEENLDTVSIQLYNTSGLVSQINSTWYNFTGLDFANYTTNVTANDSLWQVNTTSRAYQLVSDIPFVNVTAPENNSETTTSLVNFNVTVSKNVTSCILRMNESNGYPAAFRVNVTGTADTAYNVYMKLNSSIAPSFNWTRNCTDLDVRNINGTRIDFWVQSCYSANESGSFWVETDQAVTAGGYIIDVAYNNDTYEDLSNGEATFPLFDDFAGDVVNTSLWDYILPSSLGDPATNGTHLDLWEGGDSYRGLRGIRSKEQFGQGYDFHLIDKPSGGNFNVCGSAFYGFVASTGSINDFGYTMIEDAVAHVGFGEHVSANSTISIDNYNTSRSTSDSGYDWDDDFSEFVVRYHATSSYGFMQGSNNFTYSTSTQIPDVNMDVLVVIEFPGPAAATCGETRPDTRADTVFVAKGASTIPTVSYDDEYGFVNMDITNADENTTANISTNLADGVILFNATCTDSNGVYNTSLNYLITVDTIDPAISFVAPVSDDYVQNDWVLINTSVADDNFNHVSVFIYNASSNVLYTQRNSSSSTLYINFSAFGEDIYYVNATANDTLGNTASAAFKNITVDLTDPTLEFVTPSSSAGNITTEYVVANVSVTEDNIANVTVRLYNSSNDRINTTTVNGSSVYQVTSGLTVNETYYANATAVDLSGRVGYLATRQFDIVDGGEADVSFTITKPSSGCSENWGCSTGGCSACTYPFFNNSKYVNYDVEPFGQNSTVPFWIVNNTGDTALNITVRLNQTGHSQIKLKVVTAYEDNEHVCSNVSEPSGGCMYVMDTDVHTVVSNLSVSTVSNIWLFTDFVGVPGGTTVNRNISINTTQFSS